ncbi:MULTISPECIES: PIN/TRAM domain-containing protein [unclassified Lentimonas]|uniref:PIN/TRAM domain-containing protein n=1 Tax=unclassified Lentimonas TaxID=2630993 RepID=UPI0013254A00|nr:MULTISPECIES: PIN domain-containing protein [unclassified Lentimonas]CAA6691125.1 Membrane-associated protein containing RNA-binding TRAM domain and ribonuclease PIN-domain, YacL B.subtilis ortholog [Lentimonas sp. CC10]CAA6693770.1 Membrane-associated protein containing RNA-binding TRAM domain and ribonuclease PIN-domain, YacL B.subtilis ortholog [Lentimonas sp. CC19]CAA7070140.1 Membrane-associated protein containing RNA-binding TRAM domain and ribonuclease PIN-domain, YacL B.subtilis ortho
MKKTLLIFRIFFLLISFLGCALMSYQVGDWSFLSVLSVGMGIAVLVILIDLMLEGFSLRGLSAITFGLIVGGGVAYLLGTSPLFEPLEGDPELAQMLYLSRLALYVISMYLATVIALRGRDEFNLVIPYVRFSSENVETPLVVVDTSALIDGRVAPICESKWMGHALLIPRFVLDELQAIADSSDPVRKEKGRKGLDVLNRLRKMPHLDLRIHESDVPDERAVDSKLVFLAESMKAKLLTTDYNLAKMAEFHGVEWLNVTSLVKALNQEISIGTRVSVELVRAGKDAGQAIGYLPDGSMLVVNGGSSQIGHEVRVEVDSVVPSAGGKMIFATYRPSGIDA